MPFFRSLSAAAILFAAGLLAPHSALAQEYPTKPVTIIVSTTPGGPIDTTARVIKDILESELGQNFLIENKPGAGGVTATEAFVRAAPDGYTILVAGPGPMLFTPLLRKTPPYDPFAAFEPINYATDSPTIYAVRADNPAKTLGELIDQIKANPSAFSYGSSGYGNPTHLAGKLLELPTGAALRHVPYKGSPEAILGLLSGDITMHAPTLPVALPHVQAGTIRLLAVGGDRRLDLMPDLPTSAEAGFPDLVTQSWFVFFAPKGTPEPIIAKLDAAITKALSDPAVRQQLSAVGINTINMPGSEFKTRYAQDWARWKAYFETAKMQID